MESTVTKTEAEIFEYSSSADPVGSGLIPVVPLGEFLAEKHLKGNKTEIIPFDKSSELRTPWPATSPTLLSSFIRILKDESLTTHPNATSEVYYCIRGKGVTSVDGRTLHWKKGDFMTIPAANPLHC